MLHTTHGRGKDCFVLDDVTGSTVTNLVVSDGTVITVTDSMMDHTRISYTYQTQDYSRTIVGSAAMSLNHTTKVWTIVGALGVAADVGGSLVVTGSATSDGTYAITAASGNSITTATAPGSDETFTSSAHFVITSAALAGAITWAVNNNMQDGTFGGSYSGAGLWVDATSDLDPAPAAIAAAGSDWIQADDLAVGWSRLTFTATGGRGLLSIFRVKKGDI